MDWETIVANLGKRIEEAQRTILAMAERIHGQSELLTTKAGKNTMTHASLGVECVNNCGEMYDKCNKAYCKASAVSEPARFLPEVGDKAVWLGLDNGRRESPFDRGERVIIKYASGKGNFSVSSIGGYAWHTCHISEIGPIPASPPVEERVAGKSAVPGSVVSGVGPNSPVVTNEKGGKQSGSPYRSDLLPPLALLAVAEVLKKGSDNYGDENWRKLPIGDHINHALTHILAYLAGDKQDDHLGHAATRMLFALDTELLEAGSDA